MIDFIANVKISLVENITFFLGMQVIWSSTWLRKNQSWYCCYYIQPRIGWISGLPAGEFVWIHASLSVRTYVCNERSFLRICTLVFSEILHNNRKLETGRSGRSEFSRKILVFPKMAERAQNGTAFTCHKIFVIFAGSNLKWKAL